MTSATVARTCGRTRCSGLCTESGLRAAYAAHAPAVGGYCRRAVRDRGLAEELLQEAFVRAWRSCPDVGPEAAPDGHRLRCWLLAVARNLCIDAARAAACRPPLARDPVQAEPVDRGAHVVDVSERVQARRTVHDALSSLPETHRAAVRLVVIDDRTYRAAATELGIPEGTVKSRVHHALRALRSSF